MSDERPPIEDIASGAELRRWYWLKSELQDEARRVGLRRSGGKFEILDRLAHHRDTGESLPPTERERAKRPTSSFNWNTETLTLDTVITDSYKNTQQVRRFFIAQVGPQFRFSIGLMDWINDNRGKTLAEAIAAYHALSDAAAAGNKTAIKPHNQFNQYTRDFLEDNPDLGMADVRRVWAAKRSLPSDDGRHVYDRSDLELD